MLVIDVHGELLDAGIIQPGLDFIQEQIFGCLLGLAFGRPEDVNNFYHAQPLNKVFLLYMNIGRVSIGF
jgi:hypothetical protein